MELDGVFTVPVVNVGEQTRWIVVKGIVLHIDVCIIGAGHHYPRHFDIGHRIVAHDPMVTGRTIIAMPVAVHPILPNLFEVIVIDHNILAVLCQINCMVAWLSLDTKHCRIPYVIKTISSKNNVMRGLGLAARADCGGSEIIGVMEIAIDDGDVPTTAHAHNGWLKMLELKIFDDDVVRRIRDGPKLDPQGLTLTVKDDCISRIRLNRNWLSSSTMRVALPPENPTAISRILARRIGPPDNIDDISRASGTHNFIQRLPWTSLCSWITILPSSRIEVIRSSKHSIRAKSYYYCYRCAYQKKSTCVSNRSHHLKDSTSQRILSTNSLVRLEIKQHTCLAGISCVA